MRMGSTSFVALAVAVAVAGSPVAGQEPEAAARQPLRIRVVTWKMVGRERVAEPVAGATVVVRPREGVVDLATGRTGADGIVRLDVERQRRGYGLQAVCAGIGMQCRELDAEWPDMHEHPAEIAIEPAPGLSLAGSVVDAATGRPIAGARVFENDVNPGRGRPLAQTTTGADGGFLFAGLTPPNGALVYDGIRTNDWPRSSARGLVELAVVAPGYVLVSRIVQVRKGHACDAGVFHLEPAATIRGRVLQSDGSPFADARIDVLGRAVRSPDGDVWHEMPGFRELEVRSAADGTFTFPHAPFGVPLTVGASPYGRWVITPGLARQDDDHRLLDAAAGLVLTREQAHAEVVLREPGVDATRPADLVVAVTSGRADVPVRKLAGQLGRLGGEWPWTWNSSTTSATGPLAFARVPAGRLRLHVTALDLPDEVVELEVEPRQGPTRVEVVLGGIETIAGRIVDETGEPVAGATVRCGRPDASLTRVVPAGPLGGFRLEGLPRGRHVLRAEKPGFAAKRIVYVDAPSRDVLLPLRPAQPQGPRGPARSRGLPVPGGTGGAGVTGVVLGPDGKPAPFAAVYTETARELCDAEGRFKIAPSAVIHASTEATCPPHAVGILRLDAASPRADVVIKMAATRPVLVDAGHDAPRSARVEAQPRGDLVELRPWPDTSRFVMGYLDERGVAFLRLLPGEWTLRLVAPAKEQSDPSGRAETVLGSADVTVPAREPDPEWTGPSVRIVLRAK